MKLEHTAMYVRDLEAAKDFFVKYFGAIPNDRYHNERTGFSSYFLTFEDGPRLEIMSKPGITEHTAAGVRCGYAHIAFSVGSREEVDRLTGILRADGYKVVSGPRTTGDGYYESCIEDHEGDMIEITE